MDTNKEDYAEFDKSPNGGPAFPFTPHPQQELSDGTWDQNYDPGDTGMMLREYACIHLQVPDTGTQWLDDLIERARLDRVAEQAMRGLQAQGRDLSLQQLAVRAYQQARNMVAEGGKRNANRPSNKS